MQTVSLANAKARRALRPETRREYAPLLCVNTIGRPN